MHWRGVSALYQVEFTTGPISLENLLQSLGDPLAQCIKEAVNDMVEAQQSSRMEVLDNANLILAFILDTTSSLPQFRGIELADYTNAAGQASTTATSTATEK